MKRMDILNRAAIAGIAAIGMMASPATASTVKTLCQVEIDAADAPDLSRRPDTVGFVKKVDGKVSVFRPNKGGHDELNAEVGMDILAYDAVVTGPNGGLDAIFTDNSLLSVVPDTCIEISEYTYKPNKKQGSFRMRLGRGVVSVEAGEVAKLKGDTMSIKVRNDTNLAVTGTRIVIRAK
ncbi:MAG: FecR domain-containing protein [Pikeienuella sp.]